MMTDYAGQQLGSYRLRDVIGRGGSADVYLGEHVHLGTLAAIKVLHIKIGSDELDEFLREAKIIAHLRHPHIVRVLDFGVEGTIPFLVMDYATNGTLRQRYPKGTQLPLSTVIYYTKQVAEALQYAHDRKIVHRDVKPENMLLDSNKQLLLSDFGISGIEHGSNSLITQKRLDTSATGTVYYMAPEQILGHPHLSSDQYALGVVVYEWLCGVRPFSGDIFAIMYQHVHMPPVPLRAKLSTISPAIEQVVFRALAKDPELRFATIGEFAQALEQADQVQEAPTFLSQWQQVMKPISVVKPVGQQKGLSIQVQQAGKPVNGGVVIQQRKNSPIRREIVLITLALILAGGSVAFLFSSLNNYSRAATPASTAKAYVSATKAYATATARAMIADSHAQHTRVNLDEKTLTSANISKLVLAWKMGVGRGIGSSATVADGIVYINSNGSLSPNGYMYALNINTGAVIWKAAIGSYDFGNVPTVANGVVYMGSFDNNLYAFQAKTGEVIWKAPTGGRIGSSPTLVNGVIYIGSDDHKVYAFQASNGKELWSVSTGSEVRSSPAVVNGVVYVGSDDHKVYAITAKNGRVLWSFPTGDQVISSPSVVKGIVYIGSNDHLFYALNADTGKVLWEVMTGGGIMSSSAVVNGVVYIGSKDAKVYALDSASGMILWSVTTGSSVRSSPTVANGVVYVGSDDHKVYAINAENGKVIWNFTTGHQVVSSPTIANGMVYVGSDDGNLYAFHLVN